jgi:transcriptional regulator with GAF, ATPase, and Fis domain
VLALPFPRPGTLEAMVGAITFEATGALLRRAMESRRQDPAGVAQELGLTPRGLAKALREHGIPLEDD